MYLFLLSYLAPIKNDPNQQLVLNKQTKKKQDKIHNKRVIQYKHLFNTYYFYSYRYFNKLLTNN